MRLVVFATRGEGHKDNDDGEYVNELTARSWSSCARLRDGLSRSRGASEANLSLLGRQDIAQSGKFLGVLEHPELKRLATALLGVSF